MQQLFLILVLILIFGLTSCNNEDEEEIENPIVNVVLIIADDQGYSDLSCANQLEDVYTPHLDKLAGEGVRFTQAYATSPICNPSRAGIITGSYQQRWGTYWYGGKGIHDPSFITMAEFLKKEKYKTAYVGKVHYGSFDNDTSNRSFPLNHGFDYFYGHTSARKHYLNHSDSLEDSFQKVKEKYNRKGQSLRQQALWKNKNKLDTLAFSTELFTAEACHFLEKHKNQKFFLQLSYNAVHNFTHQLPEDYLIENKIKGPDDWNPEEEEYYDWYQKGRYPNNKFGRELYLGQLYFLDQGVGQVIKKLEELNIREKTLVVYISDNGGSTPIYANNTPLRGSKYLLFEGGIRVPMIISSSQHSQNKIYDGMVSAMDIFPTICDILELDAPKNLDGVSIEKILNGEELDRSHDTLIWDVGHEIAVRTGQWKYHMVLDDRNAKYEMVEVEMGEFLYDLESDIGESHNLAHQYPDVLEKMKKAHSNWKQKIKYQ